MEARNLFEGRLLRLCVLLTLATAAAPSWAASARTRNFIVTAATQELANEIATAAENFRRNLSQEWLGGELPDWEQPCPIRATVDPHMGAGGATSFMFGGARPGSNAPGRPHGWTMSIQGSRERVLDSVLPHEVTHTIFATHFGRPLPRWADEGACTTVEHASERGKQEKLLYQFLTTNRGIAFNKMFAMKEYPKDILPLYSQGYSLARFLIALGGKRKFVDYVGAGMDSGDWTATTKKHYGFHSLSDLQLSWVEWVKHGTPAFKDAAEITYVSTNASLNGRTLAEVTGAKSPSVLLASNEQATTVPYSNQVPTPVGSVVKVGSAPEQRHEADNAAKPIAPPANVLPLSAKAKAQPSAKPASSDGWYSRLRDEAQERVASNNKATTSRRTSDDSIPTSTDYSTSRPQPPEQVRQSVLEWKRDQNALVPSAAR